MADLKSTFFKIYSVLKSELLQDPAFEFFNDSRQWVERMLDYNVPGGAASEFHLSLCLSVTYSVF
ncbi:putative transferase [Lupinus albus]|uniref:Putative transferase n=1 Tax=Lupinus albus TaxID=3870 RepID=A0A6A4P6F5_LUPAL|nr:putative transferase [Lupinus albus]